VWHVGKVLFSEVDMVGHKGDLGRDDSEPCGVSCGKWTPNGGTDASCG